MSSPTKRTLDACRKAGMTCQVVERWNPYAKVRVDLFGIIDIVALSKDGILGIQATSDSNHSARVKKIMAGDPARLWLEAGGLLEVWSWKLRKPKGSGRAAWTARKDSIVLE